MTEYATHTEDMAGDWILDKYPTMPAALAHARLIRDECGAQVHVLQREPGGEWVHVWPKRRWWLPWTWTP